jgi:OHCU decarboxylase
MKPPSSLTLPELDALPASDAEPLLESCCGSRAWVRGMLARRPFGDVDALLRAAHDVWWSLGPDDWREAFAHHPRVGERDARIPQRERSQTWSAEEQRAAARAHADDLHALGDANREYERRFGYIFIVFATGKSAPDMLALLRERLPNDPDTELRTAAGEQEKITRLRLLKLVGATAPMARS